MKTFVFAAGLALAAATQVGAAPITYSMDISAGYGSAYGGSNILAPIDWSLSFTFDPDTIVPTVSSTARNPTFVSYGPGLTGTLAIGSQVATIHSMEALFSHGNSLRRHSFTIRYIIDPPPYSARGACSVPGFCDDQEDGLSLTGANGLPSIIDINQVQFSFGGNQTTYNATGGFFFDNPGSLATTPLDWLDDPHVVTSSNMDVFNYGIAGSRFGVLSATGDPVVSNLVVSDGLSVVPLPAGIWLLLSGIGALALARRRS